MSTSLHVPYSTLIDFVINTLRSLGMSDNDSRQTAEVLVTTDAMGVHTHGTKLLVGYLKKLKHGGYQAQAVPTVEREGPAWAIIDGKSALGMIGSVFAVKLAMDKARNCGIAYCGLRNTGHVGAIGYYAAMAARGGFIASVTGNDIPSVAVPGSKKAVLGSNPIAYGIPVADGDPILLDMATAAVAGGKVYAAHQRGEAIPSVWLIGPDGKPTTDGTLYPAQASLAPMGGHKGYGIGLWCEMLSAVLPGGNMTWQVGSWMFDDPKLPSCHNASFVLFDVGAISDRQQFDQRVKHLIDEIHATPTAADVERVQLPGEREWREFHRAIDLGVQLPSDVLEKLKLAADFCSLQPEWLP